MNMTVNITLNLKDKAALEKVIKAARLAMRDTVKNVHADAVRMSPHKTGNNKRSLAFECSGFDTGEGVVDQGGIEGAVYSTSGYGGFLEIGTGIYGPYGKPIVPTHKKMLAWKDDDGVWIFARAVRGIAPHPYIKPAADMNFTLTKFSESVKGYLNESSG